ncbi:MAG: hypothetical protein M1320_02245 [Patescibacteria group bacterium]|nr:hypothetical protein [Patescibacteria group bacterium]
MTPKEKIEYVKNQISEKTQISPKGSVYIQLYTVTEYEEGPVLISRGEQKLIIKKLEEDRYIKNVSFSKDGFGAWVELIASEEKEDSVLPNKNRLGIKPKTLELIAQIIGNLGSGPELVDFLKENGVNERLIEYPNTKWRMVYSVLLELASYKDKSYKRILFKIIEEACHPLMYKGDKKLAQETVNKFNSYLEYDNLFIQNGILWEGYSDEKSVNSMDWMDKDGNDYIDTHQNSYSILPKKIDELYIYWNELIKLTKFYFENKDAQDDEINEIYFEIISIVEGLINSNGCGGLKDVYKKPFRSMIGCEFEIQDNNQIENGIFDSVFGEQTHKPTIAELFVGLYDFLGRITETSLPDRKNLEKIKEKNNELFVRIAKYKEQHSMKKEMNQKPEKENEKIQKIQIVGGKMEIDGLEKGLEKIALKNEESSVIKGKKTVHLPHFQPTQWKDVTLRFLDEQNVLIQNNKKIVTANYGGLGFSNEKNNRPNLAWIFLLEMAKNNGETKSIPSPIPDNIKQIKRQISDFLKKLFKNDTEPFYDFSETKTYKLKIALIPPQINEEKNDKFGIEDYLEETTERHKQEE